VSWLGRAGARLVPAARRDWAEAVWAEAHEVPAGWRRLAWRVGGVWLIAREAVMMRWIGSRVLFAAAAGAAAWSAWSVGQAATVRADVIGTVLLLAGLPLLARWFLGPPDNKAARRLRAAGYAAVLALMPAKAATDLFLGAVPRGGIDLHTYERFHCKNGPWCHWVAGTSGLSPTVGSEVMLLFLTACGLAIVLALTARRTRIAPAALAVGASTGLALGVVMYAIAPLGLNVAYPYRPWLPGSSGRLVGVPAWILVFGAPLVAGAIARRRGYKPGPPHELTDDQAWQGVAAGLVSGGVGALFVTVFGTATTVLFVNSAWVRGLLLHGQHLTASAVYGRELFATQNAGAYVILCVAFPIIGVVMGFMGAGLASLTGPRSVGGRPPGPPGPPGPGPLPEPPDSGRLADAGAMA
jgi:hypothetical protein